MSRRAKLAATKNASQNDPNPSSSPSQPQSDPDRSRVVFSWAPAPPEDQPEPSRPSRRRHSLGRDTQPPALTRPNDSNSAWLLRANLDHELLQTKRRPFLPRNLRKTLVRVLTQYQRDEQLAAAEPTSPEDSAVTRTLTRIARSARDAALGLEWLVVLRWSLLRAADPRASSASAVAGVPPPLIKQPELAGCHVITLDPPVCPLCAQRLWHEAPDTANGEALVLAVLVQHLLVCHAQIQVRLVRFGPCAVLSLTLDLTTNDEITPGRKSKPSEIDNLYACRWTSEDAIWRDPKAWTFWRTHFLAVDAPDPVDLYLTRHWNWFTHRFDLHRPRHRRDTGIRLIYFLLDVLNEVFRDLPAEPIPLPAGQDGGPPPPTLSQLRVAFPKFALVLMRGNAVTRDEVVAAGLVLQHIALIDE
ncbi:hypothetical protein GGF32_008187 [Allomyces javanicus]|nr:hypothetical protein GGF32_008187 [Allomyces javanicus]